MNGGERHTKKREKNLGSKGVGEAHGPKCIHGSISKAVYHYIKKPKTNHSGINGSGNVTISYIEANDNIVSEQSGWSRTNKKKAFQTF